MKCFGVFGHFYFLFYYLTRQIQNVIILILFFLHQSYEFLSFDSDVI